MTNAPEPPQLFTGLSQSEAQKLWRQGQILAALDLAQQDKAQKQTAKVTPPQSHDVDSGSQPFFAAPPHRIFLKAIPESHSARIWGILSAKVRKPRMIQAFRPRNVAATPIGGWSVPSRRAFA